MRTGAAGEEEPRSAFERRTLLPSGHAAHLLIKSRLALPFHQPEGTQRQEPVRPVLCSSDDTGMALVLGDGAQKAVVQTAQGARSRARRFSTRFSTLNHPWFVLMGVYYIDTGEASRRS